MKLAPAFTCLATVAVVSATYGAIFPPPPAPPLPAGEAQAATEPPAPYRPMHVSRRTSALEAVRLEGELPGDLRDPSVLEGAAAGPDAAWRMVFVSNGRLRAASSTDGLTWRAAPESPLAAPEGPVQGACVLARPDGYRMWYAADGVLRHATSRDGRRFQPAAGSLAAPMALAALPEARLDGPQVAYRDGRYHVWFGAEAGSVTGIGHATSLDGVHWRPSPGGTVLATLPNAAPARPAVAWDAQAGHFSMWYREPAGTWRHAVSPDGETWAAAPGPALGRMAAADAVALGDRIRLYAAPPLAGVRLAATGDTQAQP